MSTQNLIERYVSVWNEPSSSVRKQQMAAIFAKDIVYVDPLSSAHGIDQMDAVIAGARAQFSGLTLQLRGSVDDHHGVARFQWEAVAAHDEDPVVIGFDVVTISDGAIAQVIGFLDKVPQAA